MTYMSLSMPTESLFRMQRMALHRRHVRRDVIMQSDDVMCARPHTFSCGTRRLDPESNLVTRSGAHLRCASRLRPNARRTHRWPVTGVPLHRAWTRRHHVAGRSSCYFRCATEPSADALPPSCGSDTPDCTTTWTRKRTTAARSPPSLSLQAIRGCSGSGPDPAPVRPGAGPRKPGRCSPSGHRGPVLRS